MNKGGRGGKAGGKIGGKAVNPLWPSRTDKPSGKGRGNNPPSKK